MADWQIVRYDPTYEEPLDPEVIPLCDALNAAGFVTISSCSGHGGSWPHIFFEHSTDDRIERLARFVKVAEAGDYRPYFSVWQKEILLEPNGQSGGHSCYWSVEFHLTDCYHDTPAAQMLADAIRAINLTSNRVNEFSAASLLSRPPQPQGTASDRETAERLVLRFCLLSLSAHDADLMTAEIASALAGARAFAVDCALAEAKDCGCGHKIAAAIRAGGQEG